MSLILLEHRRWAGSRAANVKYVARFGKAWKQMHCQNYCAPTLPLIEDIHMHFIIRPNEQQSIDIHG